MRIISFGDLLIDYYFKKGILIGINGGKSNANILANLTPYYNTAFIGCVGNDILGEVAIDSLRVLGVDVEGIEKIDERTKRFFIENNEYSKICPYCSRESSYSGLKYDKEFVLKQIKNEDIVVIDSTDEVTLDIVHTIKNKAFLDIGYIGSLFYMSINEMKKMFQDRFEIININENVYNKIKKKFAIDSMDLYEIFHPKILLITRGKRGCDIIANGEFIKKEIENPSIEVDTNGVGDAFFASFIHSYLENPEVNEKMISKAFMKAVTIAKKVVSNMGARTHLQPLYEISDYKECICREIKVNIL